MNPLPPPPPRQQPPPPPSSDNTPPPPTPPILQRKLSFDDSSEPKTLFEHEMNLAREAALHIMNTHTKEEALKIFLAGWVPVTTMAKQPSEEVGVTSDGDED